MTPPRGVEDAASYRDGPKSSYTYTRPRRPEGRPPYNLPFAPRRGRACPARALSHKHPLTFHIVGRGLDPSACPFPASTRSPFHHPVGAGHARPATSPPPAVNLPPPTHSPKPPDPATRLPPITPYFVPAKRRHPNIHLAQTSPSNFVEKIKKTCKNLLTKVILLAIIIKLSREPSPRRQPLEPLPTACTPFFEENFFKNFQKTS